MGRVLVACEESQAVTKEFRRLGHEAFSCDIVPCSGGHPEWHLEKDVSLVLGDGWDLMIAHPPCTHLAVSGARWFHKKQKEQKEALDFVRLLLEAPIDKIMLENPVSIISSKIRKPDQIIQPWQFGDPYEKTTCLWLKNLPPLEHTKIVKPEPRKVFKSGKSHPGWYTEGYGKSPEERRKLRSKTFPGIATAIAEQWGKLI